MASKSYINTKSSPLTNQALQLMVDGRLQRFQSLHATVGDDYKSFRRHNSEHKHDVYHVVLYIDGDADFSLDGKQIPARRGVLALCPPGVAHSFPPVSPGHVQYSEVTFCFTGPRGEPLRIDYGELLSAYSGTRVRIKSPVQTLTENATRQLDHLMARYVDWWLAQSLLAGALAGQVMHEILCFLLVECCNTADAETKECRLAPIRQHIDANYAARLTVDELAQMASMSRAHFLREFKRAFGKSPIAYQLELRMGAAKTLLRASELRCGEIGERVGYDDLYHFSKAFKKATGLSPTAYRNGQ